MEGMKPLLIYCYDAWCGWCYGFSQVMTRIAEEYSDQMDVEVLSGGMILPDESRPIADMAGFIQEAYKTVEERTGIKFGTDFLWHVFNPVDSDWFPHSEKPAIAMCVFKEYHPELQVAFAADLQYALNYEGRDLTDNEAYRHLLEKFQIPEQEFYRKLKDPLYREKAHYEFALVKQLKVSGFPTALIQASDSRFYVVARGYTDYENFKTSIDEVLHSITTASSS